MKYIHFLIIVLTAVFCLFQFHSCKRPQKIENIIINLDLADFDVDESYYLEVGGKVLYTLPTPIEASMLIKNWGVPKPELLNDPSNASKYLTKKKMATNLGIYITDMTLAGLYGQAQTVLQYKDAIQELIKGLDIQALADPQILQKIEDNINNRDVLMEIISDIYAICTLFLSADDRDFYAMAMLAGGWVEGMYIATGMIDENLASEDNLIRMKAVVMDNKPTFDLIWSALSQKDIIPEEAVFLMLDMSYAAHFLGHQTLLSIPANVEAFDSDKVTRNFFADFKDCIQVLRHQFTR